MNRLLLLLFLCAISFSTNAQFYKQSAGVRGGFSSAISYKYFYNDTQAIEFMISERNGGMQATGTYVFHKPLNIMFTDMLYMYYGVGVHLGFEEYTTKNMILAPSDFIIDQQSFMVMGINTTFGIEYRMLTIPLTFGLDIKPYIQLVDMRYGDTKFWDVGASVKYVF